MNPKTIKKMTSLALVAMMFGAGQNVLAHTGIKDKGEEGVALYSAFTLSHGCATNAVAEGAATTLGYDGNTSQKDVIAQSVLFPNAADSVFGKVDSNSRISTPLALGDELDIGAATALPLAPLITYPQPLPESYIVRDSEGNTRGFQIWGGVIPQGGGSLALSGFKVSGIKFKTTSCAKSLKVQIAIANYCQAGRKNNDKESDRADIWIGEMTSKFNDPLVMPNAATVVDSTGANKVYWPTLTINRNLTTNPLPSGCDPVGGYDLAIQPSAADIDANLPMKKPTKSRPKLPGNRFWPNI